MQKFKIVLENKCQQMVSYTYEQIKTLLSVVC